MCENCKILTVRCVQYEMEIKALELRVEELEELILEELFNETRRQMLEDRD